jgi:hypothetical protein
MNGCLAPVRSRAAILYGNWARLPNAAADTRLGPVGSACLAHDRIFQPLCFHSSSGCFAILVSSATVLQKFFYCRRWVEEEKGSERVSFSCQPSSNDTGNGADKKDSGFFLTMGAGVAARAKRDQVVFGVVARVTPKLLVMDLQV